MVSEIRVPSSSSSSSDEIESVKVFLFPHIRVQGQSNLPTLTGWILTPSSTCAVSGSSDSLCSRTFLPQRVFTKVVRPDSE